MAFRVAIFSSNPTGTASLFLAKIAPELAKYEITFPLLVHDLNRAKRETPIRHLLKLARRQSRVAGNAVWQQVMNILAYKYYTQTQRSARGMSSLFPDSLDLLTADTVNSPEAIAAVKRHKCDLVCLMGSRILTKSTLDQVSCPIINIHSSDPRFVRGGPPVFWEILSERSRIGLTIHHVEKELDTGGIIAESGQDISWGHGLGPTIAQTMAEAKPTIVHLFRESILSFASKTVNSMEFQPGPLRVTPSLRQVLLADRICRMRYGAVRSA